VLLDHRCVPARPALAQVAEVGDDHRHQDGFECVPAEDAVEDEVRVLRVQAVERRPELGRVAQRRPVRGLGRGALAAARHVDRLGRGQPALQVRLHRSHASHVLGRVEPQSAVGPPRLEQAVATLPRAQ
jgi:hypothetical protein